MKTLTRTLLVGVAAIAMSAMLPAAPSFANDKPTASTTAPMTKESPEQHALDRASPEKVEARIKELHDKLGVTADQEGKWKDVADAMRETAKDVRAKVTERTEKAADKPVTAVDELKTYAEMAEAHYDGAKRIIGPFEKLYDAMTPEQKKDADELFAHPHMRADAGGMGAHHHVRRTASNE
jgi:hypothetical protein